MASPPSPLMQCDTTSSLARMLSPKMMKRSSSNEWSGSSGTRAYGPAKAVVASSDVTPRSATLVAALAWSHSNLVRLVSRPYAWHNYRVTIPSTSRNTRQSPTGCHPVPHVARTTGERRPESRLFRKTMLEASDSPLCLKLTEKSPSTMPAICLRPEKKSFAGSGRRTNLAFCVICSPHHVVRKPYHAGLRMAERLERIYSSVRA